MALSRRNTSLERIEIDPLHGLASAAIDNREPIVEVRRKADPGGAELLLDAARSPLPRALADLVGREEPGRLGAGQRRLIGRACAMGEADAAGVLHLIAEMLVQPCAQFAVAGHVD